MYTSTQCVVLSYVHFVSTVRCIKPHPDLYSLFSTSAIICAAAELLESIACVTLCASVLLFACRAVVGGLLHYFVLDYSVHCC